MKAEIIRREEVHRLDGAVLVSDVRDSLGRVVIGRGTLLGEDERILLAGLSWEALHVVRQDTGDLLEAEAGTRLTRAAAGDGVRWSDAAGGHWPLISERRGVVEVRHDALLAVNGPGDLAVYTVADGQVVDEDEVIARVKVIPFVVESATVGGAVQAAVAAGGLIGVRAFAPTRAGVVVLESLGSTALERFRRGLEEKVAWFGSTLLEPCLVPRNPRSVAAALDGVLSAGAGLILVAGTAAMDPLDPAFEAIRLLDGRIERVGVPAHPGSLLWLARLRGIAILGMPSCGLFSRATIFDLVLPRLLCGQVVDSAWLASLGHGGLLTRDVSARFPPYRPRAERGAVD